MSSSVDAQPFAPVALFVYNRPEHTFATLEALADNTLARRTDLVIFSDGPKQEAASAAVDAVRGVIAKARGFASVRLVERETNMGLARSVISGTTELLNQYGKVIVIEDDLLASRQFLAYMNRALTHYERTPKAFSVTGYCYPPSVLPFPAAYPHHTFASYRCHSWGWATWKDRWDKVDWSVSDFEQFMEDEDAQRRFNRGGNDLTNMLGLQMDGLIDSWAIRFCYAHFRNEATCIYPVRSLICNIGFDGSGAHCTAEDSERCSTTLDHEWIPTRFSPPEIDQEIAMSYKAVHGVSSADTTIGQIRAALERLMRHLRRSVSRLMYKEKE